MNIENAIPLLAIILSIPIYIAYFNSVRDRKLKNRINKYQVIKLKIEIAVILETNPELTRAILEKELEVGRLSKKPSKFWYFMKNTTDRTYYVLSFLALFVLVYTYFYDNLFSVLLSLSSILFFYLFLILEYQSINIIEKYEHEEQLRGLVNFKKDSVGSAIIDTL